MAERGRKYKPYVVNGPKEVILKPAAATFPRGYVLALLLASAHKQAVPHGKATLWYLALIDGKEYHPSTRGKDFNFGEEVEPKEVAPPRKN